MTEKRQKWTVTAQTWWKTKKARKSPHPQQLEPSAFLPQWTLHSFDQLLYLWRDMLKSTQRWQENKSTRVTLWKPFLAKVKSMGAISLSTFLFCSTTCWLLKSLAAATVEECTDIVFCNNCCVLPWKDHRILLRLSHFLSRFHLQTVSSREELLGSPRPYY